ncbi:MAG: hypothetical protein ACREX4_13230 [Gammaproteobacteria bacterium]
MKYRQGRLFVLWLSFVIATILPLDRGWSQTPPATDKPSQKSDPTITTQAQPGETVLFGRLDSTSNGICLTANDKNTYELTNLKDLASKLFWESRGKTIMVRGKPVQQRPKFCRFTLEVSSWSFFPEGDRAEHWDTFQNKHYAYEVKYPPWWHVTGQTLDRSRIHFQLDPGGYGRLKVPDTFRGVTD